MICFFCLAEKVVPVRSPGFGSSFKPRYQITFGLKTNTVKDQGDLIFRKAMKLSNFRIMDCYICTCWAAVSDTCLCIKSSAKCRVMAFTSVTGDTDVIYKWTSTNWYPVFPKCWACSISSWARSWRNHSKDFCSRLIHMKSTLFSLKLLFGGIPSDHWWLHRGHTFCDSQYLFKTLEEMRYLVHAARSNKM